MAGRVLRVAAVTAAAHVVAAEFQGQEFFHGVFLPCNVSLTTKVANTCRAKVFKYAKYDVWAKNLDFSFGRLSEDDWTAVKQQYTAPWAGPNVLSGQTPLFEAYSAEKNYNLLDFLPITVRGLVDYDFIEEDDPLPAHQPVSTSPRTYKFSILVPNCWSTVYETMRTITQNRKDDVDVYHHIYSTDDKKAIDWLEASTELLHTDYTQAERRFGDAMFIYLEDPQMLRPILEHAVIFIDNDIVFEKAGTGDLNPYRLTNIATLEKEWAPTRLKGLYSWHLRRPKFGPEQAKSFVEAFSLESSIEDQRWPQFWSWPTELKQEYTLGVADNPRNLTEIYELTLLKARKYVFCQDGGRWTPCHPETNKTADAIII